MQAGLSKRFVTRSRFCIFLLSSEQKAYLEKVKQERLVKEELMSQDDEEDIPVTEREMNLKVTIYILLNFFDSKDAMNLIFHKNAEAH